MIERNFVTPETLAAIDDVNRKCHALHVPAPPVVFVTTELFERDGSPVLRQHEQARSWTRNFYNFLASRLLPCTAAIDPSAIGFGAGSTKVKATNGAIRTGTSGYNLVQYGPETSYLIGNNNSTNYGIFIGTGNGAFDFEGYSLLAVVPKGTGSGQMVFDAPVDSNPIYDSEVKKWTKAYYRDFTNNSGNSLMIYETGLYWDLKYSSSASDYFMVERNVLTEPVPVADGQTLRVTYTTEMTFPA